MSITDIVIIIIIGFVLFELIEHVIFPLVWYIIVRKRKPLCGIESMIGKEVMVQKWQKKAGGFISMGNYGKLLVMIIYLLVIEHLLKK